MPGSELSLTVTSFALELARGWQKLSLYNEGHPARAQVAHRVHAVLTALLAPTGSLALGVARGAFVTSEERVESDAVARLADALFVRNVAVIRFAEGAERAEVEALLESVPRGQPPEGEGWLGDRLARRGVRHIALEPIDFSGIVATAGLEGELAEATLGEEAGRRLYDAILARLIGDEELNFGMPVLAQGAEASLQEVLAVVSRLLQRHGIAGDGEEPVAAAPGALDALGRLGQVLGQAAVAGVLSPRDRRERLAAVRYVGDLLGAIPESLREAVLDSALRDLATDEQRGEAFSDLAGALSAAQLVASLRRLRAEQVRFSEPVVGLLEDLIVRAAPPAAVSSGEEDAELTAALRKVFAEEDVDRFGPPPVQHDRLALSVPRSAPSPAAMAAIGRRLESLDEGRVVLVLAQTLVSLVQRPIFDEPQLEAIALRLEGVVQTLIAAGHLAVTVRIVQGLQSLGQDATQRESVRQTASRVLGRLAGEGTAAAIVEALSGVPTESRPLLLQLIGLFGDSLVRALLLALSEETDLGRRRQTFDLLGGLGERMVPHAVALLDDPRWYTTRNMLALLRQGGRVIPPAALQRVVDHPDARVRLEAAKSLGAAETTVTADLLRRGLDDDDAKVAEATVAAIGSAKLESGRALLLELLAKADPLGRQTALRVRALAALGELGHPEDLAAVSHLFRRFLSVASSDERRAAFAALAGYPAAARAPWLEKGLRSADPKIRDICRRIAGAAGRGPRG